MADLEDLHLDDEEEDTLENKFLMCVLGKEEYGINIVHVQSIEELQKIVAVPDMPSYVKGVINLRGQVIPVIDLRIKFNMDKREYDDRTCIVITKIGKKNIGMIVDTVSEVKDIKEEDIEPPPRFKDEGSDSKTREQYVAGLGKIGTELKILLDVSKLLEESEINKISGKANFPASPQGGEQ